MAKIEIAVQTLVGPCRQEVDGFIYGAWAAHTDAYGLMSKVTFVEFGLAVPYEFETLAGAKRAAKKINALRDSWEGMSQAAFKHLGKEIMSICSTIAGDGARGPKGTLKPLSEYPAYATK